MKSIEKTVSFPDGISIELEGKRVKVSASGKQNEREFHARGIDFEKTNNSIKLKARVYSKKKAAIVNAIASHLGNMAKGLINEYEYRLAIVYSHFPMNVSVKENLIEINNFAGEKKPRRVKIMGNTKVEVKGKEIFVKGVDKEAVGQTAANLERATKITGRDRRTFQDGIFLVEKGTAKSE